MPAARGTSAGGARTELARGRESTPARRRFTPARRARRPQRSVANDENVPIKEGVAVRLLSLCWLLLGLVAGGVGLGAAEVRPTVGPGASKDEVIDAYGWPNGQSQAGTKEIFSYAQGTITFENGRVEKVDFLPNVRWQTPKPRPGAPSADAAKKALDAPVDFWLTSFEEAAREATRRHARILAAFTGSDWSPASKQFYDEVMFHPDFVNAFTGDFVFLRVDFPSRAPIAPELKEQNNVLRERYGVTVYPSLMVLSPGGLLVAQIDLAKAQNGDSYRARVIAAVREVRDALITRPPAEPNPDAVAVAAPAPGEPEAKAGRVPAAVKEGLKSAGGVLALGITAGVALAVLGLLWVWRQTRVRTGKFNTGIGERISDAAAGLPKTAEMQEWSREKLRSVCAGLAESEGYEASPRSGGNDADLTLRRAGELAPRVIVWCVATRTGPVPVKRVRELFGTMTAEGAPVGWLVAPQGFSNDAREFADQHDIVLIDADRLFGMLRDLPPLLLPKVLTRVI
jgi:hypothetical protein